MKKNIKTFLIEIITIIVGILVALFINDWNDDRKDKAYIEQMFVSIRKELKETNDDIDSKLKMQQVLVDSLDYYLKNDTTSISQILTKAKGIYMPFIKISSWKAIANTRIELVEYDKISTLSNIEESKETLDMQAIKMADYLYSNMEETQREKKEILKLSMQSIMGNEKSIQQEINKIIGK